MVEILLDYIADNVHWIFGGIGISAFTALFFIFKYLYTNRLHILNYAKKIATNVTLIVSLLVGIIITAIYAYISSGSDEIVSFTQVLTVDELEQIHEYAASIEVEDGIGQLFMVGVPADFTNYKETREFDDFITANGVGSIILNGYNFYNPYKKYDDTNFLDSLIAFNNALQDRASKSELSLPLLLASDFESYNFTSIKNVLIPPPSALSIGAMRNKDLTYLNGQLVGTQLSSVGIHLLLGPVLDSYNVRQNNKSTLQDRCFAGSPLGTTSIGSHFIKGVRENGARVFVKHFPNYGAIEDNPHDALIPKYEGSLEQLQSEIKPILHIRNIIDGLMTSHVNMPHLDNKIATFSCDFVGKSLVDMGFGNQIIISDDLSSMGAIKRYMNDSGDGFSEIAIKSFSAGHDILLFAHFSEMDKRSNFTVRDLRKTRLALAEYIKTSRENEKKFRASFEKIIRLKAEVAKQKHVSIGDLLGKKGVSNFHIPYNSKNILNKINSQITYNDSTFKSAEDLVKESIRQGSTTIISKTDTDLTKYKSDTKLHVYVYGQGWKKLHTSLRPLYRNSVFTEIPIIKNSSEFREIKENFSETVKSNDLVIYTVYDKSDADLIAWFVSRNPDYSKRIILFCQNSPMILDNVTLNETTVIATFTNHPFSYDTIVDILINKFKPRDMKNLPISIGDNGKFYNVGSTVFIEPVDVLAYEKIMPKYLLDERTLSNIKKTNYLIPRHIIDKTIPKATVLLTNLFFTILFIRSLIGVIKKSYTEISDKDFFQKSTDILLNNTLRNKIFFITAAIAISTNVFTLLYLLKM